MAIFNSYVKLPEGRTAHKVDTIQDSETNLALERGSCTRKSMVALCTPRSTDCARLPMEAQKEQSLDKQNLENRYPLVI